MERISILFFCNLSAAVAPEKGKPCGMRFLERLYCTRCPNGSPSSRTGRDAAQGQRCSAQHLPAGGQEVRRTRGDVRRVGRA